MILYIARVDIQQLCADTGCSLEDLPGAMDDRDGCQEKVSEIHAISATGWLYIARAYIQYSLPIQDVALKTYREQWTIETGVKRGVARDPCHQCNRMILYIGRAYIQQLCADTGCSLEDLPGVMDDRDGCQERVTEINAISATGWYYISLEPIYNSSVPIQDVALKTYREQWAIETGVKRGLARSMPSVQQDDIIYS